MTDKLNPKQPLSVEESVLATMWAMEAIVELLQSKGLCSKQEVHDMVSELRTRHAELNGKAGTAMQAFRNSLSDVEIASIITFERNSFGNQKGDMIQPAQIKALR